MNQRTGTFAWLMFAAGMASGMMWIWFDERHITYAHLIVTTLLFSVIYLFGRIWLSRGGK